MICMDRDENMLISGDFDSDYGRVLHMNLIKCQGQDYCASDEEIKSFLKSKFLTVLHNEIIFDANSFGEDSIIAQSTLKYYRINT